MRRRTEKGYTLVELVVAMGLGLVVLAAATTLFTQAINASNLVAQRGEMQQNARAAINSVSTELSNAGTGIPYSGIDIPDDTTNHPLRGSDFSQLYLSNNELGTRLYPVHPGFQSGTGTKPPPIVTITYVDQSLSLNQYPVLDITPSGSQVTLDSRVLTNANDAIKGIKVGDLMMVYNTNGSALGVVTNYQNNNGKIVFASSDPLNINVPSASHGTIANLKTPGGGNNFPPTSIARVLMVTYYLQPNPGADNIIGTSDDGPQRLMRQINAMPPIPVAENIENLQVTYDTFDESSSTVLVNTTDADGKPTQIRKVNVAVNVRSARYKPGTSDYMHFMLATSVSPRNLSFRDRYK